MATKAKTSKVVETTKEDTLVKVTLKCVYGISQPETIVSLDVAEADSLIKIGFATKV